MWKRILVPHDFSACAARALRLAKELAEREGASLALVHVSPLPPNLPADARVEPPDGGPAVRIDELTTRGAKRELEAIAGPLRAQGLDVRTTAVASPTGDVAAELLSAVEREKGDVIVIGTHGRTGLSHVLLGSVAEKVIRSAKVPVITVRTPAPEAEPTREEDVAEDELAG